jgi:hypothetical protein
VATRRGSVAEVLIRSLVTEVRHGQNTETTLGNLLFSSFDELPSSPHVQVVTVPGIGAATAAVLVAKVVDIDRFATPNPLVNSFGAFPEENTSGVDKHGNPLPAGTLLMSHKGNDLVRGYLGNAARSAIRHNPAVGALDRRLRAKGKRGDVAMGRCMRKLLHLAFAVWKTHRDRRQLHFPSCCLTRKCYQGSPPLGGDAMPSFIRECIRSGEASQLLIRTIPLLRCHRPLCTNDGRFFTPCLPIQALMNQRLCHHVTPPATAALQGAELPSAKPAGMLPLEPLQQRLGGRPGISLKPPQDLRPNRLEWILPRPPRARGGRRAPVGRTDLAPTPQLGKLGEKRLQTRPFRTMTPLARTQRSQSGWGFADLMHQRQRIQRSQLGPECLLDGGCNRGMSQETFARGRGRVMRWRGSAPGGGQ